MQLNVLRERFTKGTTYPGGGAVVYWMSRDQRVEDNWALLHAQAYALKAHVPFAVVFTLVPHFSEAGVRQYEFMLTGLKEVERALATKHIPFFLLETNHPGECIARFVSENEVGLVVYDFDPLKIKQQWQAEAREKLTVPCIEVDAHNIVPSWVVSNKEEVAARTFRPKLHRLLSEFLVPFPKVVTHPIRWDAAVPSIDWKGISMRVHGQYAPPVTWITAGATAGREQLRDFVAARLQTYAHDRNDPVISGQSDLSPYFHFGQIAPQRAALAVVAHVDVILEALMHPHKNGSQKKKAPPTLEESAAAFLEELIVRRELSDNFCLYNPNYDSFLGAHAWAQKTLTTHQDDPREYTYTLEDFEHARTHDELWNAAQRQMVTTGKMHGYMRMYWAKKILEWTLNATDALYIALLLNDRYELDGRDPNGYAGVMWSICGIHDRPWFDRPIFGLIRYMSYGGAQTKFSVDAYIKQYPKL
jgi:deoxyribodipyrimidine photo-lyase